jgi:hypothetical protein
MSKTALTCGKCDDGWICKVHPDQPWPHDQCPRPAMPGDVVACPFRKRLIISRIARPISSAERRAKCCSSFGRRTASNACRPFNPVT